METLRLVGFMKYKRAEGVAMYKIFKYIPILVALVLIGYVTPSYAINDMNITFNNDNLYYPVLITHFESHNGHMYWSGQKTGDDVPYLLGAHSSEKGQITHSDGRINLLFTIEINPRYGKQQKCKLGASSSFGFRNGFDYYLNPEGGNCDFVTIKAQPDSPDHRDMIVTVK